MRLGVASAASTFILSEKDWLEGKTEEVVEAASPVGVPDDLKRGCWSCKRAGGALTAIPEGESRERPSRFRSHTLRLLEFIHDPTRLDGGAVGL